MRIEFISCRLMPTCALWTRRYSHFILLTLCSQLGFSPSELGLRVQSLSAESERESEANGVVHTMTRTRHNGRTRCTVRSGQAVTELSSQATHDQSLSCSISSYWLRTQR